MITTMEILGARLGRVAVAEGVAAPAHPEDSAFRVFSPR